MVPGMAAPATKAKTIYLVGGTDEFGIKEAAVQLAGKLAPKGGGEFSTEIIDGWAGNQDEALRILGRVREALTTVGLFGDTKLVWLKSTNLLADERGVQAEAVKEGLADLAELLKGGLPDGVTLLVSAIGCDRRKSIYKTIEKLGTVQFFETLKEGRETDEAIAEFVQRRLRDQKKTLSHSGYQVFREWVAADLREIANELDKLCLYVGMRGEITEADVRAICSVSRQAVIWELADALGSRSVVQSVRALENLLGNGESAMGIVALLAAQFRFMLLTRELMDRKLLVAQDHDANGFVRAFERLPVSETGHFPKTKEGKLPSPWRLYRCALAARNFTVKELIHALDRLVQANIQLVSTQLDERLVLEQLIVAIAGPRRAAAPANRG
jgi:DNA polymerase-3 subunit delta